MSAGAALVLAGIAVLVWLTYVVKRRAPLPEWLGYRLAMTLFGLAVGALIAGSMMIYVDAANRCADAGGHLEGRTGQCVEGRVIRP